MTTHRLSASAASALCTAVLAVLAVFLGPAPTASAATTFGSADVATADWGERTMTIASEYQDASGAYQRWFITTGALVRRIDGPSRQRVEVRYVLQRRTAEGSSRWGEWTEVQSEIRTTLVVGDDEVDLLPHSFPERTRAPGTVSYRVVFNLLWRDADTGEDLGGTLVLPSVAADASCQQITHIPCRVTDLGTIYSGPGS